VSRRRKETTGIPGSFYRRPNSPWVWYKLYLGEGRTFRGATSHQTEKAAEADKRAIYEQAVIAIDAKRKIDATTLNSTMETFEDAAELYWKQKGQFLNGGGDGADNERDFLDWLLADHAVGRTRKLTTIDDAVVSAVIAIRRGEDKKCGVNRKTGKPITMKGVKVSNATVNRSVRDPFRRVVYFARDIGRVTGMQSINWKQHKLPEPKERVREMQDHEEVVLRDGVMRHDYLPMITVGSVLGFRASEQRKLEWKEDILWSTNQIKIRNGKGANGADEYVPMTPEVRKILLELWAMPNRHPVYVFTWESTRNDPKKGHVKGVRYPYTKSGWSSAWKRVVRKAGISGLRWHDASRHTAASRAHRQLSLKETQTLLRHKDERTTGKYAHVRNDDIVAGLSRAVAKAEAARAEIRSHGAEMPWKLGAPQQVSGTQSGTPADEEMKDAG
jgi:integrase